MSLGAKIVSEIEHFKDRIIKDFPYRRDLLIAKEKGKIMQETSIKQYIGINTDSTLYMAIIKEFNEVVAEAYYQFVSQLFYSYANKYMLHTKRNRPVPFADSQWDLLYRGETFDGNKFFVVLCVGITEISDDTVRRRLIDYDFTEAENIYVVILGDIDGVALLPFRNLEMADKTERHYTVVNFNEFLNSFFNREIRKGFIKATKEVNAVVDELIGYSVTEICSKESLTRFKSELVSGWKNTDYNQFFADSGIYPQTKQKLINKFLMQEKYNILLDGGIYSDSYITSEWFYHRYARSIKVNNFDMTAVVAGYFKSVEQLLDAFIVSRRQGKVFQLRKVGDEYEEIRVGDTNYKSMLGGIHKFLFCNRTLFDEQNLFLQNYYLDKLKTWINTCRNGYFHKDNIQDSNTLHKIRQKTLSLYFFTLVMFQFDD